MPRRRIDQVIAQQQVLHLPPTATVREAARQMMARRVASVVISATDGELDGIFTERDLLTRVVVPGLNPDLTTLGDVMTDRVLTVTPAASMRDALLLMDTHNVRHMPVVDGRKVLGVVSIRDFLGGEMAELEYAHEVEIQLAEHMM